MFKNINFIGSVLVAFALGSGIYAFNTYLTVLMQNYIGWSAFDTGIRQLALSIWSLILGPVVGILGNKFSKKWMIVAGLLVSGAGFIFLIGQLSPTMGYAQLWPTLVMIGIANGIVNPVLNSAGLEGVAPQEMGMASGLLNVFRQFGTSFGVVILGLVEANRYGNVVSQQASSLHLPEKLVNGLIKAGPFSGHEIAFSNALSKAPFAQDLQKLVVDAFDKGLIQICYVAGTIVLIGAIGAAIFMRESKEVVE